MVRLELTLKLEYEISSKDGADFILNIHAAQTPHQTVVRERLVLSQELTPEVAADPSTGTRFMRLHAGPGPLVVQYESTLDIQHHRTSPGALNEVDVRCLPLQVMQYIYPSRYCQSDRLLNLAAREFGSLPRGYSRVQAIERWVRERVRFASSTSDGHTSAVDTLIDGEGVCRDFAHLMIALCRAVNIPARVATGTDYGADPSLGPPDLHAYVEVYLSDRWYLFDPSGTTTPMGLMRFGVGRDAADVAFATIFGSVESHPPFIRVRAVQGQDLEAPEHLQDALSTAGIHHSPSDCTPFSDRSLDHAPPQK